MGEETDGKQAELDALKTLFEGYLGSLKLLTERSYSTTIQTVTLNLVVISLLVSLAATGKGPLQCNAKWIGSLFLFGFNSLVTLYLIFKGLTYSRIRTDLAKVENALTARCPLLERRATGREPNMVSFWKGTGVLCIIVVLSGFCSIAALWVDLIVSATQ